MVQQSLVRKRGKKSKRTGERKQTCYDFDGVTGAAGQVRMMEEGGIDMKNKHKEMKIQNTKQQESQLQQMGTHKTCWELLEINLITECRN